MQCNPVSLTVYYKRHKPELLIGRNRYFGLKDAAFLLFRPGRAQSEDRDYN